MTRQDFLQPWLADEMENDEAGERANLADELEISPGHVDFEAFSAWRDLGMTFSMADIHEMFATNLQFLPGRKRLPRIPLPPHTHWGEDDFAAKDHAILLEQVVRAAYFSQFGIVVVLELGVAWAKCFTRYGGAYGAYPKAEHFAGRWLRNMLSREDFPYWRIRVPDGWRDDWQRSQKQWGVNYGDCLFFAEVGESKYVYPVSHSRRDIVAPYSDEELHILNESGWPALDKHRRGTK